MYLWHTSIYAPVEVALLFFYRPAKTLENRTHNVMVWVIFLIFKWCGFLILYYFLTCTLFCSYLASCVGGWGLLSFVSSPDFILSCVFCVAFAGSSLTLLVSLSPSTPPNTQLHTHLPDGLTSTRVSMCCGDFRFISCKFWTASHSTE